MAGVSVTTVSRVLNDPGSVSEKRKAAVVLAMKQLDFRPSIAARTLATGRSKSIALVVSDTNMYGYSTAIQGVEEAARRSGFATIITVVDRDDDDHARAAVDVVVGQSVAGVIGLEFDTTVARTLREIPKHVPMAVVSVSGAGASARHSLHVDDALGTLQATTHLLALGHRTVHYFVVENSHFKDTGRVSGWRHALTAAELPVPPPVSTGWSPEAAYRAATTSYQPDMTALLCHNDEIAMGVMSALHDLGLSVPGDVSVIGVDDHPIGRVWQPRLTTVQIDFFGLGGRVFALLHAILKGEEAPTHTQVEPVFVLRSSTAKPRSG
jgi:DNA-binding LacI/PurR family transcriptional regulator